MCNIKYSFIKKSGINTVFKDGKIVKTKPWLGDIFAFSYDKIMEKSVLPKKLNTPIVDHENYLKMLYGDIHSKEILELACGSGNLSRLISNDNKYAGLDISRGLLKRAVKNFKKAGFVESKFYQCGVNELPFEDNSYDIVITNLSLNFFPELEKTVSEIKRVLRKNGLVICSVPVPEKNENKTVIHGKLFSAQELKSIFENAEFKFEDLNHYNGAVYYFKAYSL